MRVSDDNLVSQFCVFVFVYLHLCICIRVFTFVYLYLSICIWVFVFEYLYFVLSKTCRAVEKPGAACTSAKQKRRTKSLIGRSHPREKDFTPTCRISIDGNPANPTWQNPYFPMAFRFIFVSHWDDWGCLVHLFVCVFFAFKWDDWGCLRDGYLCICLFVFVFDLLSAEIMLRMSWGCMMVDGMSPWLNPNMVNPHRLCQGGT